MGDTPEDLGRQEEELKAAIEAVESHRALAQRDPDTFQPGLARSLLELCWRLDSWRNPEPSEEFLTAIQEAVSLFRILARREPEAFQRDLITSLGRLDSGLSRAGRHEEALTAVVERVELHRALAQRDPDAFLPGLARSLRDLAHPLSALGRSAEALKAMAESVELCWALARAVPPGSPRFMAHVEEHMTLVIDCLGAVDIFSLGRLDEAQAPAQCDPKASLLGLAGNFNQLTQWLNEAMILDFALSSAWKTVILFLAAVQPSSAGGLEHLCSLSKRVEEYGDLGLAVPEAVELWRTQARHDPEAFHPGLADAFTLQSSILDKLGQRELALTATQAAVELRRVLAQRDPEAFQPDLAWSLHTLGHRLMRLGRHEEALTAAMETVELRRALARRDPHTLQPELAASLSMLGMMLLERERYEEALAVIQEASDRLWSRLELYPEYWERADGLFSALWGIYSFLERPLPAELQERRGTFERFNPKRGLVS